MLPYGMVRYHGAPADIRHLPSGVHLHARMLLPLQGDEEVIPLSEAAFQDSATGRELSRPLGIYLWSGDKSRLRARS
ncbi:MAG: hypothetical protein AAF591_22365, partial [Verrucomicrobiota bacterium]